MAKVGRPKIKIDWTQFEKLCALQCTLEEIAGFFGCSGDTIETRCKEEYGMNFSEVFRQKRQNGKVSLRRNAFKLAEKNPAMCIFLLKNHCGMTDSVEVAASITDDTRETINDLIYARTNKGNSD